MPIYTTKHRSSLSFVSVTSTILEFCRLTNGKMADFLFHKFSLSNFSLPQPNIMKLIHNAYNHKTQIQFELWMCHFYRFRVMPFTNFCLPQPNGKKLIHNAYLNKIQIKFEI